MSAAGVDAAAEEVVTWGESSLVAAAMAAGAKVVAASAQTSAGTRAEVLIGRIM